MFPGRHESLLSADKKPLSLIRTAVFVYPAVRIRGCEPLTATGDPYTEGPLSLTQPPCGACTAQGLRTILRSTNNESGADWTKEEREHELGFYLRRSRLRIPPTEVF
jgi:hypothetical protein